MADRKPAHPAHSRAGRQLAALEDLLREHPRQHFCSRCLATQRGFSSGAVAMLAARLESHRDFRRSYGDCDRCGLSRLVIAFVGIADEDPLG